MMLFDPYQKLYELTSKIYTYNNDPKHTCILNNMGQLVCYKKFNENGIICDKEYCNINITTLDNSILKYSFPSGIWINLQEYGNYTKINILGNFHRSKLDEIKTLFPYILINETEKIVPPTLGIPKKDVACNIFPFLKKCNK